MNCAPGEIAIITRPVVSGCRCQTCVLGLSLTGRIVRLGVANGVGAWKLAKPLQTRWWEITSLSDDMLTPLRAKIEDDGWSDDWTGWT